MTKLLSWPVPRESDLDDLTMKEKALGNIEEPDTKLKRFRASDSLMRFLEGL